MYRQSPTNNITQSRQSLYRQPRISPPRKTSPRKTLYRYRSTTTIEPLLRDEPASVEGVNEFENSEANTDGIGDQVTLCQQETKDSEKVTVRRLRKVNSKRHACTQCSHFRLQKYFNDVSCMVCISCLNICSICFLSIDPSPLKKERNPKCNSCIELKKLQKKSIQRQSMKNLRIKKKSHYFVLLLSKILEN